MTTWTPGRWKRLLAAATLAVALVLVAFAPRVLPGFVTAADLVEGSGIAVAGICTAPVDAERAAEQIAGHRVDHADHFCGTCVLFSAPGLGAVAAVEVPAPRLVAVERLAWRDEAGSAIVVPKATARGPPAA